MIIVKRLGENREKSAVLHSLSIVGLDLFCCSQTQITSYNSFRMLEQSVAYAEEGSAGGGGGRSITQPLSPGDNGKVGKDGNKNSLARFLTKAGVRTAIAQRIGELSVSLFSNMDSEGLHCFAGEDPADRAIMRAAQASLKVELASEEAELGKRRNGHLFDNEEEEDDEEGVGGRNALAVASGQRQVEDLRNTAMQSRKQPRSEVNSVYNDPYMVGATLEAIKEYSKRSSGSSRRATRPLG